MRRQYAAHPERKSGYHTLRAPGPETYHAPLVGARDESMVRLQVCWVGEVSTMQWGRAAMVPFARSGKSLLRKARALSLQLFGGERGGPNLLQRVTVFILLLILRCQWRGAPLLL